MKGNKHCQDLVRIDQEDQSNFGHQDEHGGLGGECLCEVGVPELAVVGGVVVVGGRHDLQADVPHAEWHSVVVEQHGQVPWARPAAPTPSPAGSSGPPSLPADSINLQLDSRCPIQVFRRLTLQT